MKIISLLFLSILLSACNMYELAGQETEISDELEALLPQITVSITTNLVRTGPSDFFHNTAIIKINGGERFNGNQNDDFKAAGKVQLTTMSTDTEFNTLISEMTVKRSANDQELEINFRPSTPTPTSNVAPGNVPADLIITVLPSAYTNNMGTPIKGTTQIINFHP